MNTKANDAAATAARLTWTNEYSDADGSKWVTDCGRYEAEWGTDEAYHQHGTKIWNLSDEWETLQGYSTLAECKAAAQKHANDED